MSGGPKRPCGPDGRARQGAARQGGRGAPVSPQAKPTGLPTDHVQGRPAGPQAPSPRKDTAATCRGPGSIKVVELRVGCAVTGRGDGGG